MQSIYPLAQRLFSFVATFTLTKGREAAIATDIACARDGS